MEKKGKQRITITDAGGDTLMMDQYDNGMLIAPDLCKEFDFDALRTLKLRDDDIILLSYTRSGSNWLWKQLRMIRMNSTVPDNIMKQSGFFELNAAEKLDLLPSPRILNTHVPYGLLPEDVQNKKTKLVFIYRNPKDVAVSFFHFHSRGPWWQYNGKFENHLGLFCDRKVDGGRYADYLNDWAKVMEDNPDLPIHVLTYEGLKENPVEELSRICRFLGLERDVSFLQTVTEECTITKMRDRSTPFWEKVGIKDGASMIHRKGIVGDWKNHFTVAQSEQFDQYWSKAFTASKTFPMPGQD